MQNRKCKNFVKKCKICAKNGNYAKNKYFAKHTEFLKTNAKFQRKSCEHSSKKTKFWEYKTYFSKRDLSTNPIDGLTQI